MPSNLQVVSSKRGVAIEVDKNRFTKLRESNGNIVWRCAANNRKCAVYVTTDLEITRVLGISGEHQHPPLTDGELEIEQVSNQPFHVFIPTLFHVFYKHFLEKQAKIEELWKEYEENRLTLTKLVMKIGQKKTNRGIRGCCKRRECCKSNSSKRLVTMRPPSNMKVEEL